MDKWPNLAKMAKNGDKWLNVTKRGYNWINGQKWLEIKSGRRWLKSPKQLKMAEMAVNS